VLKKEGVRYQYLFLSRFRPPSRRANAQSQFLRTHRKWVWKGVYAAKRGKSEVEVSQIAPHQRRPSKLARRRVTKTRVKKRGRAPYNAPPVPGRQPGAVDFWARPLPGNPPMRRFLGRCWCFLLWRFAPPPFPGRERAQDRAGAIEGRAGSSQRPEKSRRETAGRAGADEPSRPPRHRSSTDLTLEHAEGAPRRIDVAYQGRERTCVLGAIYRREGRHPHLL